MRNYIGELKQRGYSLKRLASETGISSKRLSAAAKGEAPFRSATKYYEAVRNANRRLAYREARISGLSPERAGARRRTIFDPELKTVETTITKVVKAKAPTTRFQLRIYGEFFNSKERKTAFQYGYSHAYLEIDKAVMEDEAIIDALYKLGDTEGYQGRHEGKWQLRRIIEREMMKYVLTDEEAAEDILDAVPDGSLLEDDDTYEEG